jgi:predicted amidohydrolase
LANARGTALVAPRALARDDERIITVDCPIVAETPVGRLGLAVCYDLDNVRRQFPVLAHRVDCE